MDLLPSPSGARVFQEKGRYQIAIAGLSLAHEQEVAAVVACVANVGVSRRLLCVENNRPADFAEKPCAVDDVLVLLQGIEERLSER